MEGTFRNATNFNQDISGWDVSNVTHMDELFEGADGLSIENQCAINTTFSANENWPYDWSGNCDDDNDGIINSDEVAGCQDSSACNYDETATDDDGSCTYAEDNFDCDGECIVDVVQCMENCI